MKILPHHRNPQCKPIVRCVYCTVDFTIVTSIENEILKIALLANAKLASQSDDRISLLV